MRREGWFALRYHAFSIHGRISERDPIPVLAECYGGPFEIFSTKSFPGLQPSTDLTRVSEHVFRTQCRRR